MIKVSIILVHYGKRKILDDCIRSIRSSKPKVSYEIVVIDNNAENRGYSRGNNLGVEKAKGEYILILNPDTIVHKGAIDTLVKFIETHKKVGAVAPTFFKTEGESYPLQGTKELTPLRGIFGLSFLNKIFPNNPISKEYWMLDADRNKPLEVDVVPGTAFLIKKDLFVNIGGFDNNFFLYFEEFDLGRRIKNAGYKLFIIPDAKVTHYWGAATPKTPEIKDIFTKSRFYYFRKNFGLINAIFVEVFARFGLSTLIILFILALGTFLRFYQINPNMIFTGEMGRDYIDVWNIIHGTRSFLIGPRTSHEWLFLPPLAYWIYTVIFLVSNYSPPTIIYTYAAVGSFAILVCYYYIQKLFGKKIALISAFLVAISPYWISYTRFSRYNFPVAILFFPYLYYLWKSIKNNGKSLFGLGLILGLMLNFFPSPFLLIPATIISFIFYRVRPRTKYICYSILGFVIPNITFIIYEFTNKFAITSAVLSWIPYRVLGFFGLYPKNTANSEVLSGNVFSIYHFFARTFAGVEGTPALVIFLLILLGTLYFAAYLFKRRRIETAFWLVVINLVVVYTGLFIHGDPPEHYYMTIFPIPLILAAFLIVRVFKNIWTEAIFALILGVVGLAYLIQSGWFYRMKIETTYDILPPPYSLQLAADNAILNNAAGRRFSLHRIGVFDYFEYDFAQNYIFVLMKNGAKIVDKSNLTYTIVEGVNTTGAIGHQIWSKDGIEIFKVENSK